MTNRTITQSQKRFQDSLASLFTSNFEGKSDFIFVKSSTDIGVQRNGGRNGARFAPQSLLAYFKKLNIKPTLDGKRFTEIEVGCESEEQNDFKLSQLNHAKRIEKAIKLSKDSFICHLGGGHDHIFPLLTSFGTHYKKIIVINIDAHADTRTDDDPHSGTPFRQFDESFKGQFLLYQVGLLEFANSTSTIGPLKHGQMEILWKHELSNPSKIQGLFQKIKTQINKETLVVFSFDADAMNGNEVPGVSAVNGNGLKREELNQIWDHYRQLPLNHGPILGIYELNPVYDTVSMLSMRFIGSFLYDCL